MLGFYVTVITQKVIFFRFMMSIIFNWCFYGYTHKTLFFLIAQIWILGHAKVRHTDSIFSISSIPVFLVLESLSLSFIFEMGLLHCVLLVSLLTFLSVSEHSREAKGIGRYLNNSFVFWHLQCSNLYAF